MATIEVRIKKGQASIDVEGASGPICHQITQKLQEALGEVKDVQEKPEYFVQLDGIKQEIYEE